MISSESIPAVPRPASAAGGALAPHRISAPRLTFYHPTVRGGGAALRLEYRWPRAGEERAACLFLELALQLDSPPPAPGAGGRMAAQFDWERKATVKLDFFDVCEVLAVLQGRQTHAGGERGLYHAANGMNTVIACQRREDGGVLIGVSRRNKAGEQIFKGHIVLRAPESAGLAMVLEAGMFPLAFGLPPGVAPWNSNGKATN